SHFADGAAFVPLASLTQATQIAAAVAKALGMALPKASSLQAQLDALLDGRTLLLVLDNFEHLLGPAGDDSASALVENGWQGSGLPSEDALALIRHIMVHHPTIRLLITSRERLRITGEQSFELGGLAMTSVGPGNVIAQNEAVLLFVQRATQVAPDFALTPANQEAIWRICTLLEGVPLAIELAAAWSHVLSPAEIAEEIARDLDFLARGDRSAPSRHRSLRGLFDHSWVLLTEEEQRVMSWLALFSGGFTRQTAQAVARVPLPLLAQLVDKSLIRVFMQPTPGGEQAPRYYIHNLLRVYLLEKLTERADGHGARLKHAMAFTTVANELEAVLYAGDSGPGLLQLNDEHANFRAALRWTLSDGNDSLLGLELAGALGRFWHLAHHWREGRQWLAAAVQQAEHMQLAQTQPTAALPKLARALVHLGTLQHALEENQRAFATLQQGLALWQTVQQTGQPDPLRATHWPAYLSHNIAWSYFQLGIAAGALGNYTTANDYFAQSLARYRATGDRWAIATVLNQMSANASTQGDYATAERLLAESLPILREIQQTGGGVAVALNLLGRIVLEQGDAARAIPLFEEALGISQQQDNRQGQAWAWLNLGLAYLATGALSAATEAFESNRQFNEEMRRQGGIMAALEGLAATAAAAGRLAEASRFLVEAEQLRQASGQLLTAYELAIHERTVATVQAHDATNPSFPAPL
ncbi:MAG TPA: tetratricopeptide repeat protein, partial [Caldilineaceae bacterium]|nr:tetratricopeptide repeat protein [Caldilineaceae bacterium]